MDVKQIIEDVNAETLAFIKRTDERFATVEKTVDELARKAGRPGTPAADARSSEHTKAFLQALRTGDTAQLREKAMSIGSNPDGGFTVPQELDAKLQIVMASQGAIRSLARNVRSRSGKYEQPIRINQPAAAWVSETGTRALTTTPSYATVTPPGGGNYAALQISNWLITDSTYNLEQDVINGAGVQFGLAELAAFISGDGVNKPKGILQHALALTADDTRPFGTLQYMKTGAAGTFTADHLLDLQYLLAPAYRKNCAFVMHPSTAAFARKLKDSQGRYIWEPNSQAGMPGTLFGCPLHEDPFMPTLAAGANAVVCGNFEGGYSVVDVGDTLLVRDQVTARGHTVLYLERRVHGSVTDSNALKVLQTAV